MSRWLDDWLELRSDWPAEWRDAADQSDYHLTLTADGLSGLMADLHAVVERHLATQDPTQPTAQRVTVLLQGFPTPERIT